MTTTSSSSGTSTKKSWFWLVNAIAFGSLVIIGIALFLSSIGLKGQIKDFFQILANALAYIVVAACSFVYALGKLRRKHGIWYMIVWAVSVVLVTIGIIIPVFSSK